MPCDRAKVAAGPDDDRCFDRVVDDPRAATWPQARDGCLLEDAHAGTAEQELVEFAAADGKADDAWVLGLDEGGPDHSGPEAGDLLQRGPGCPVLRRVQFEQWEHLRREPARAYLVARKPGAIGHNHVPAGPAERPGAGRSRWPSSDDKRIAVNHADPPALSNGSSRVQNGGTDSRGAKTT